jgi:hypothetical protein
MDDSKLPARFPSPIEIVGAIAAAVPFTFSMASSSMQTVNGQVTAFTYRDPIAIGGGVVAVLCGVLSIAMNLRNTEPAKRTMRIVLCLAIIGAGVYQGLRGFGIAGIDKPDVSPTPAFTPPSIEPAKPTIDTKEANATAQSIIALWSANKMDEVLALAQPEVAKDFDIFDIRQMHDCFEESFGALQKVGELPVDPGEDNVLILEGPATFAKATLQFKLTLIRVDGKLLWRGITFNIPKDLQHAPVDADGDAYARAAVDELLAKKFDPKRYHPRLVDRTPPDIDKQLDAVISKFGGIKKIGDPVAHQCDEARCVTFPVTGKKTKGQFEVDLSYMAYAWRVTRWNLTHE